MAVSVLGPGKVSFLRCNAAEAVEEVDPIRWWETFLRFYGRKDEREEFREVTS